MSNNKIILDGCVEQFKSSNELTSNNSEIFEIFCLNQIMKEYSFSFEDIQESIVDGGNDGGIDSIFILVDDINIISNEDIENIKFTHKSVTQIIVTQCKTEISFKESSIDKLITSMPEIFNLETSEENLLERFNNRVVEKCLVAQAAWKSCLSNGGKLKIRYKYCCRAEKIEISNAFERKKDQLIQITESSCRGSSVDYTNYSSEELLYLYQQQPNERLSITFKENPLSTSYQKNGGIGYVGTVHLNEYRSFLTDENGSIREHLFESNIRHFQGNVDVNKKIQSTIKNPSDEDFWWLNNGITIIASNPTQLGKILTVENVQIVNGLQTSYSIFNQVSSDIKDERSVLVKVIVTEDKATIDNIIASTNSQNAVAPVLLRATDEVQREIEIFFSHAGYYYDRRKNFYKNQGKPANRIFSIQTTAQSIESIIFSNPYTARSKPTTLIKDDHNYFRIFNKETDYRAYLVCCLVYRKTSEFWSHIVDQQMKNKISNFKLHLSRIAVSVVLELARYSIENVSNFDVSQYDQESFNQSVNLLNATIDKYQDDNPEANLINMAKSKSFSEETISYLDDTLWLL